MKSRILISLVAALGFASAATAATITVDTDKATYLTGETITVTTTLITTGGEASASFALLELVWSDPQIDGVPGPAVYGPPLTSGGGFIAWSVGAGNCLATSCLVIDQLSPCCPTGAIPDPTVNVGTVTMVADAVGTINFSFGFAFVFGATPTFGANAAVAKIIPEPGTAALLSLGLAVLAMRRRRAN